MGMKPVYEIDGARFSTLEAFFEEISHVLIPGAEWGRNLDALNDILRGGFGTPQGGFTLNWKNSKLWLSAEPAGSCGADALERPFSPTTSCVEAYVSSRFRGDPKLSQQRLGYPETVRQLEERLTRCHPSNQESVADELDAARKGAGSTVFDWLIEIIENHSRGGREFEDGVDLILD
jgi:RNAse (barnase) inhibitor barstar